MPPPQQAELDPAMAWLEGRFAEYYRRNPPGLPDRFTRREFGFLFFGGRFMLRHTGFKTKTEFERFFPQRGPAHAYYSTAYYAKPDAPTMNEKGWMGAELIFDLDADHVPGAEKLPLKQQLDKVKEYFRRLVNDFLRPDFGFSEDEIILTFSGGRGYHAHVVAERALQLTGQERRDVVDYITGTGLDIDRFTPRRIIEYIGRGKFRRPVMGFGWPGPSAPGWGRRINEAVRSYVASVPSKTDLEIASELDVSLKEIPKLREDLPTEKDLEIGSVSRTKSRVVQRMVALVVEKFTVPFGKGETDEPVTSDTKRLIRLPGSLHGKTGLRVVTLRVDQLEAFDPLVEALAFTEEPVKVQVVKPVDVPLGASPGKFEPGPATMTEAQAAFAIARGAAKPL